MSFSQETRAEGRKGTWCRITMERAGLQKGLLLRLRLPSLPRRLLKRPLSRTERGFNEFRIDGILLFSQPRLNTFISTKVTHIYTVQKIDFNLSSLPLTFLLMLYERGPSLSSFLFSSLGLLLILCLQFGLVAFPSMRTRRGKGGPHQVSTHTDALPRPRAFVARALFGLALYTDSGGGGAKVGLLIEKEKEGREGPNRSTAKEQI